MEYALQCIGAITIHHTFMQSMEIIKQGGIFNKIEDETVFKNTLTVLNGTVAWDIAGNRNEYECIDIDPMTIFECPVVPDIPEI